MSFTSVNKDQTTRTRKSKNEKSSLDHVEAGTSGDDDDASLGPRHRKVTAIVMLNEGFACACGPDKIFLFKKSENIHEFYIQVNVKL